MQDAPTSEMLFSPARLIEFASDLYEARMGALCILDFRARARSATSLLHPAASLIFAAVVAYCSAAAE